MGAQVGGRARRRVVTKRGAAAAGRGRAATAAASPASASASASVSVGQRAWRRAWRYLARFRDSRCRGASFRA
eukprot:scaffold3317_cov80-Phaeocystis_antarctica.AAC.7